MADEADVTTQGSTGFSVPNQPGAAAEEQPKDPVNFTDIVPEAYKEKPWVQKFNNVDDFFKSMDNQQELLGKRPAGIPQANAPKDEWDQFYNDLGRPSEAKNYEITLPADMPEEIKLDAMVEEFKTVAHDIGLTQDQASKLAEFQAKYEMQVFDEFSKKGTEQNANADKEFDELASKTFGERADEVLKEGKVLLDKYMPEDMKQHLEGLDNKSLITMAAALDGMRTELSDMKKKYEGEDSDIPRGDQVTAARSEELLAKARELMQSKEFTDPFHINHDKTKKEVEGIYQTVYGKSTTPAA